MGMALAPLFTLGGRSLPIGSFLDIGISSLCWFTGITGKVNKALMLRPQTNLCYLFGGHFNK